MRSNRYLIVLLIILTSFNIYAQQNKPNILLIIADDMGIDVTNGYQQNDRMPTTPNLDALRESGLTFTNTWTAPQCTPTRASIMSGKYGIKTGVMRPPGNLDLIHESLFSKIAETSDDAYAGAVIGKWHISNPVDYNHPMQHGIDHYEGLFTSSVDDYYAWDKVVNGTLTTSEEYVTTDLTDSAIDWISDQTDPWFLWLAHAAPHGPFHVPPADLYTEPNTNNNLGKYLASIEAMDHEIGRLLDSMDEETRENTIILFIGDNGTPGTVLQNFPSNHSKGSLYEGGVRVPFIVSGKGVSRINEVDDNLNHAADLYATILELTGEQVSGGIYNSMSLKPLFSCESELNRSFIYTDYENGNTLEWAIRNEEYKLIEDENGNMEFYKISEDILEENDLIGNLSPAEQSLLEAMQEEVEAIRTAWSCNDGIQNGDETTLDDCDDTCTSDNTLSTTNIGCCETPDQPSVYYEYIEDNLRRIYTNNFPDHDYCYNSANQMPSQTHHDFGVDLNPTLADEITKVVRDNGRPARYFGVAKNGVIFAPAPAAPFIFEDQNTGEYNWDWVLEPTNNQGQGADVVGLDCASAHTGGQGYHYHGNMFSYVENEIPGISTTDEIPETPLHIGWAADGFPIMYRFGPDLDGNIKELVPGFQLRTGLRPGDDITEPCGTYSGKYTRDYEFICGKGELDECNGIQSSITIETENGIQTFEYFYVITSSFPQIPRCLRGMVSEDFDNGNDPLEGVDEDNDGFLSDFDCDDTNADINPLAEEIVGNDVDENCDGIISTSVQELLLAEVIVSPNPSSGNFSIEMPNDENISVMIFSSDGKMITNANGNGVIEIQGLSAGLYILKITTNGGASIYKKQIIK
ncbi:MAG: sulfatase-like hydrolase/transferase [Saprospiraceae bacterium]